MEEEDKEAEDDLTQMSFKFCNVALTQLIGYDISKTDFRKRTIMKNQGQNMFFSPLFRQIYPEEAGAETVRLTS